MQVKSEALVADIRKSFLDNIAQLQLAFKVCNTMTNPGYVHVWPKYWIAVKFNADVCHGVSVDRATVTHRRDTRWFVNGNKERTVLMNRREALERALQQAKDNLEQFDTSLAKAA